MFSGNSSRRMSPGPNSGPQPSYSRGNSGGNYDNFHNNSHHHHHHHNPNHLNTHNTNNPHPRRFHHQ